MKYEGYDKGMGQKFYASHFYTTVKKAKSEKLCGPLCRMDVIGADRTYRRSQPLVQPRATSRVRF